MEEDVDSGDLSNSQAFICIDELLRSNRISEDRAERLREKYTAAHEFLLHVQENELKYTRMMKALSAQASVGNEQEQAEERRKSQDEIEDLKKQKESAESELAELTDVGTTLQSEIFNLDKHRSSLKEDVDEAVRKAEEMFRPQIEALNRGVQELRDNIGKSKDSFEKLKKDREDCVKRHDSLLEQLNSARSDRSVLNKQLSQVFDEPEKLKKQADVVQTAADTVGNESQKLLARISSLEQALLDQSDAKRDAEDERYELAVTLENQRAAIEQKTRMIEDIAKGLEGEKDQTTSHMAEKVEIEVRSKQLHSQFVHQREALGRLTKDKDNALRQHRKIEQSIHVIREEMELMKQQELLLERECVQFRAVKKKSADEVEELRKDVDILISNFLKEEGNERRETEHLRAAIEYIRNLEREVADSAKHEDALNKQIKELSLSRENISREAGRNKSALRSTLDDIKVKDIVILELEKRDGELSQTLKEMLDLYSLIKRERNKYANLIQISQQGLSEIREKNKILENELEVLRREGVIKDKELSKLRLRLHNEFAIREAQRGERNKLMVQFKSRQEENDEKMAGISRLNSTINLTEQEMLRLKREYEHCVESRNFTGVQLIDRNDELCILYEKANIQESILKNGEVELRKRAQEIRMLNIEHIESQRQIEIYRKLVPEKRKCEEELAELRRELQEERDNAERLSRDLETPENKERWRALGGKDPSPDDLRAKIQALEDRISEKEEQLMEKDILYEEITTISERLRKQAMGSREETLDAAKMINDYQCRLREVTRKMMATLSELSIYQATSMKLEAEKNEREAQVNSAIGRFERGLPPTDECDYEFDRSIRDDMRHSQEIANIKAKQEEVRNAPATITRTTAEPRPNAYIPNDDLGLPRPYGGLAPFKPFEAGATMRHIRKPVPKEIEI